MVFLIQVYNGRVVCAITNNFETDEKFARDYVKSMLSCYYHKMNFEVKRMIDITGLGDTISAIHGTVKTAKWGKNNMWSCWTWRALLQFSQMRQSNATIIKWWIALGTLVKCVLKECKNEAKCKINLKNCQYTDRICLVRKLWDTAWYKIISTSRRKQCKFGRTVCVTVEQITTTCDNSKSFLMSDQKCFRTAVNLEGTTFLLNITSPTILSLHLTP